MRHRYRMPHPGAAHAPCLPVYAHRQAAPRDSTVLIVPQEIRSPRCVAFPYATAPAGTLARLQSSVATNPEVLLRPLCWCGAQPCFLKGLGGRLWRVCPLVSRLAVLMMRQLKRRGKTMSVTMIRPNVRKVRSQPNAMRADRVARASVFYQEALQERGPLGETVLTDLLADLRHLCDRLRHDFAKLDRLAYLNYLNETRSR